MNVLAFDRAGKFLAAGSDTVALWQVNQDKFLPVTLLGGETRDTRVEALAFSPDGSRLASGNEVGAVKFWKTATGEHEITLTRHRGKVTGLVFTRNGRALISSDDLGELIVWTLVPGKGPRRRSGWQLPGAVHGLALSGSLLYTANGNGTISALELPAEVVGP